MGWDFSILDLEDKVLVNDLYKEKKYSELLRFLKLKGVVAGSCGSCLAKHLPDWIEWAKYYKFL